MDQTALNEDETHDDGSTKQRQDLSKRPGLISSEVVLTINTEPAKKLVLGRRTEDGPAIVGLFLYAKAVNKIVTAARRGDIFATWYLVQIEERLQQSQNTIKKMEEQFTKLVSETPGLSVDIGPSDDPVLIPLNFNQPYAYLGAQLIALYDKVVTLLIVANKLGSINNKQRHNAQFEGANAVRSLFQLGTNWTDVGQVVNINEVREKTAIAQEAQAKMGELPEEILTGERSPQLVTLRK